MPIGWFMENISFKINSYSNSILKFDKKKKLRL